jgi:tetratricopeptide (TPR) repeat protein
MLKNRVHQITACAIFTFIAGAYIIMAFKYPLAYIAATYEDLVGEWMQVLLFLTTMLFALRLVFVKSRFRIFFLILALASFYTVMEEISWGQRLFDFSTPDFFQKHNLQQETNIHNFITGPFSTKLKRLIEYALFTGLVFYGLIYPMFVKFSWKRPKWMTAGCIPAPPLYLWPFFVLSAVLELAPFRFNEAEIAEILIPMALTIFLAHHWILFRRNVDSETGDSLSSSMSGHLALIICSVFIIVMLLSFGITYASYSSPRLKAKIDDRIENGIEKFAERYKRYELWQTAARLYHMVDEKEPDRPSIQRKLAKCYIGLRDKEKSDFFVNRALDIDFNRIKNNPGSVSAHISVSRTYDQIEEFDKADHYLSIALKNALERTGRSPDSAGAAYWLGKAYFEMGTYPAALDQFKKAFDLKPLRSKYKKALIKTRIKLENSNYEENEE